MSVATWKTELALKFTSLTSAQNVSLLDAVNDSETHWNTNHRIAWLVGIGVLAYTFVVLNEFIFGVKAPKVGRRSFWEPRWLVGLRFARNSAPMVLEGYHKFKGHMFKVMRNDSDILVLPPKYVEELRDMPEDKISATDANIKNMVGRYTVGNISVIRDSDLHRRALQQKLTPALGTLIPPVKEELVFALKAEVNPCKDWTPTHVTPLIINVVARVSARIFVGPDLCRNAEWLYTSIHYTRNIGITRNLLRVLPPVVRPVVARLLPSYWRIYSNLAAGKRLLGPIIEERRRAASNDPAWQRPNDFLQWLIDGARPEEGSVADLVHRQLLVSLGSIHTTSMMCTHFFLDLCAHPEYLKPLRDEMVAVLREDGGFKKTTLNKLRKLDSFLRESQRMNPPFTLSFQRVVRRAITLKDGTCIPAGTHLAMPSAAMAHDEALLPDGGDPEAFDAFRYERLRQDPSKPENINRFQFATTDSSTLHFGHGKYACPGRFFASNEIKVILCHLLLRYDFKFPEGQRRPANWSYEEAFYPDPTVPILMRERAAGELAPDIAALVGA
ncbi:hypothetical protein N8I77_013307 [Diaporthe amygdali]|uniref:Uncharacterized protein n=1 Tax=Phomopsis amygdali TaxID=1214568 RepID=A0AAD9S2G8_PHOAM|nr:hypothetical protein N8I77_013307 [Diaporthe amygdali]